MVTAKRVNIFYLLFCLCVYGYSDGLVIPGTSVQLDIAQIATPSKHFNSYKLTNSLGNIEVDFKKINIKDYFEQYQNYLKTKNITDIEVMLDDEDKKILKYKKFGLDKIINLGLIIGDARGTYGFHSVILASDSDSIIEKVFTVFASGLLLKTTPDINANFSFYKFMNLSNRISSFRSDQIVLEGGTIASMQVPLIQQYNIRVLAWNRSVDIKKALLGPGEITNPYHVTKLKTSRGNYSLTKVKIRSDGSNEVRYGILDKSDYILTIISVKCDQALPSATERRLDKEIGQIGFPQ